MCDASGRKLVLLSRGTWEVVSRRDGAVLGRVNAPDEAAALRRAAKRFKCHHSFLDLREMLPPVYAAPK